MKTFFAGTFIIFVGLFLLYSAGVSKPVTKDDSNPSKLCQAVVSRSFRIRTRIKPSHVPVKGNKNLVLKSQVEESWQGRNMVRQV